MQQKFLKIKKLLNDYNVKKIDDFLTILNNMELSDENKLSGLLYYCLRLNKLTEEEIKNEYLDNYKTVLTLDKLDKINYNQQNEEAENIRKMFFAITKDIRIIMIKIAFITAELRHPDEIKDKTSLTNSIFYVFAPLSARLG